MSNLSAMILLSLAVVVVAEVHKYRRRRVARRSHLHEVDSVINLVPPKGGKK